MDNVCYLLLYTQCVNNIYVSVYVRLNFHTNSNGGKRTERENKKADIISMYNQQLINTTLQICDCYILFDIYIFYLGSKIRLSTMEKVLIKNVQERKRIINGFAVKIFDHDYTNILYLMVTSLANFRLGSFSPHIYSGQPVM